MKRILSTLSALFLLSLCSCGSDLTVKASADGSISFNYSAVCGKELMATVAAITGSKDGIIFSKARTESALASSGFLNTSATLPSPERIAFSATLSPKLDDAVSKSGLVSYSAADKIVSLILSAELLHALYAKMPDDFQSYMDLFMAPVFTGEDMSDADYLDLVTTVYGQPLVDELKNASVKITVISPTSKKTERIPLLKIMNLKEKVVIRA